LEEICVSVEVCNYCEQNEANDIEHIAPKSFYPELAFIWENYLLACKQCNTGLKLDEYYVLDANNDIHQLIRKKSPPFKTHAFINPRIENPNDFMIMNMETFRFEIFEHLSKKDKNKAKMTLKILELNQRDILVYSRKQAANYYFSRIKKLVEILNANNKSEIQEVLSPYDSEIDITLSVQEIKEKIKKGFKEDIQTYQHPSVWYAIKKIENIVNPRWQQLFKAFPEALKW